MKIEYFIGIVPPKEYLERLEQFQSKWINKLSVEPHITLKAQGGLSPDKKWIDKVHFANGKSPIIPFNTFFTCAVTCDCFG